VPQDGRLACRGTSPSSQSRSASRQPCRRLDEAAPLRYLPGMPATKPSRLWSSADLDAAIERVTPDVLALLADNVPRTEAAIVAALAGRHAKDDVRLTLMRLDVVGQLDLWGSRYTLATAEAEQG
jgi:hypothetical protein